VSISPELAEINKLGVVGEGRGRGREREREKARKAFRTLKSGDTGGR
jgi:hypothetical protein